MRAGQVVMEGFLRIRLPPWLRRISTRLIAVVPAAVTAGALLSCCWQRTSKAAAGRYESPDA